MIDLQLLGTTAILDGDRPDLRRVLVQPKRLALFTYLMLASPRDFHRRDKLLALFWPERADADARAALSDAVYFLRKRLGENVIVSRGNEEIAVAGERVRCDAIEFERAVDEDRFAEAVGFYAGDLLDGFHLTGVDEFERWLESERARLRAVYVRALETVAVAQERDGEREAAIESWRRLCELDPYDSRNALRLVESLARLGRPAAALREAEAHAALLRSELGMEPPEEFAEFADRLRAVPVRVDAAPEDEAEVVLATERHGLPDADRAADDSAARHGRFPPRRLRPWGMAGGTTVLILMALAAGTYLTQRGTEGTGESLLNQGLLAADEVSTTAVAVLPFTVRGDPDLAYLREGLVTLLSTKLDGAGDLRSADPRTLLKLAGDQDSWDPQQASGLAAHFGAGLFVMGNVVEVGGGVHLDASLYELGMPLPSARAAVEGAREDLFSLVDRLAVELLATRLRQPEPGLRRAADLTTHSLPALRAFLDGEWERRAFRWTPAIQAYQRAVREDSTFALAHLRLSTAAANLVDTKPLQLPAVEAALRHRQQLSRRDQVLLDAHAAGMRGHGAETEERLRRITALYPDDAEAWFLLGDLLFHGNAYRGRSISEAREAFERAAALDPSNREFLAHLVDLARLEGRFAEVGPPAERMGERYPQYQAMMKLLGGVGAGSPSDRAAALVELSRLDEMLQLQLLLWTAVHGPADLLAALMDRHAERPYELADPPPWSIWRPSGEAAQLAYTLGRLAEGRASLEELRRLEPAAAALYEAWLARAPFVTAAAADLTRLRADVEALSPDTSLWPAWDADVWRRVRLMLLGILSVRLDDFPAAARHASDLAGLEGQGIDGSLARVGSHTVRAMAARARGHTGEALRLLETVEAEMLGLAYLGPPVSYPDLALQLYLRAELLRELGRDGEALPWYPLHAGSTWLLGPLFVPVSHLRVAEIHDRRGEMETAIHHYTLFTLLWRDADPELQPLVAQAERRLAALLGGDE